MPTPNGRLTRTAKRKLQRFRAMLRKTDGVKQHKFSRVNSSNNAPLFLKSNKESTAQYIQYLSNTGQHLLAQHSNIQRIYYKCLEIWDACFNFRYNKIDAVIFVSNMTNHVKYLYTLVVEDSVSVKAKVKPFLKSYFNRDPPNSLIEYIGHLLKNTKSAVMKLDEGFEDDENQQPAGDESKLKYKLIFAVAKNRIPQTIQPSEIISAFNKQLTLLVEEITNESSNNYEEWRSNSIEKLGEDKAKEVFSTLGMQTLNDFANLNFQKMIVAKNIVDETRITVNDRLLQRMWTFYEKVLSKVCPRSTLVELGTLETCQLLRKSLDEVFNPLGDKFKRTKELYDFNAPFLGHVSAMNVIFSTLNVKKKIYTSDNSILVDLVADTLHIDRMAQELTTAIVCDKRTSEVIPQLNEENVELTVLSLCDKFYQKVEPKLPTTTENREKRVKERYQYFVKIFITFIQQKTKSENGDGFKCRTFGSFSDQKTFISNYKNVCEASKVEKFASAVEYFTQENNLEALAEKYISKGETRGNFDVEICNEIDEEDGMRLFSINEGGYCNLRAYKSNAARLFDLNVNQMELVKWENGAVILKCGGVKYVIFQTVDTRSMIAMEIDTSKEPCS